MLTTGSSFALHPATQVVAGTAAPAVPSGGSGPQAPNTPAHHFSFDDFLDIVNPLQHLPIIGTVYRAITHDKIDTPEKIIGDTLYGGIMGLASSVADALFEKATGHNFGDTILAFLTGHHDAQPVQVASTDKAAVQVANAAPATTSAQAVQTPSPVKPSAASASTEESALSTSLTKSGTASDLAQRALFAYRRANGLMPQAALSPF